METQGKIREAYRISGGHVIISLEAFEIGSDEALNKLIGEEAVDIKIVKHREKRSLNANAYFWQLISQISKKLLVEKMDQYLLALYKYGCFIDVSVIDRAIPILQKTYRYVEILEHGEMNGEPSSVVRCYRGSSTYSKEEMSDLINGTVEDANDLGIDVLPPSEIEHLISVWEGSFGEQ